MSETFKSAVDVKLKCRIRHAQAADSERLVDLAEQLGYTVTQPEILSRLQIIEQDPTRGLFVSLDASDRVVGFIDLDHRVIAVDDSVDICGLVTDKSVRGDGHGEALLRHAESWARERGVSQVALRSNVIRTEAHGFYQRRGYEIYKTSYALRKRIDK